MGAVLLLPPVVGEPLRRWEVAPSADGRWWVLTLYQDDEEMGGGRFQRGDDDSGFDEGYQSAIEMGEVWA